MNTSDGSRPDKPKPSRRIRVCLTFPKKFSSEEDIYVRVYTTPTRDRLLAQAVSQTNFWFTDGLGKVRVTKEIDSSSAYSQTNPETRPKYGSFYDFLADLERQNKTRNGHADYRMALLIGAVSIEKLRGIEAAVKEIDAEKF